MKMKLTIIALFLLAFSFNATAQKDVSEKSAEAIKELKPHGFQGFLIGENFMKTDNPGKSAEEFIKQLD